MSFFLRAQQAIAANLEIGVGGIERSIRGGLSRLSVREIEGAQDEARRERFAAERRRDAARGEAERLDLLAADWRDKAAYALTKDRRDLAAAALERQLDCEQQRVAAHHTADDAAAEVERLAALVESLGAERTRMAAEITATDRLGASGAGPAVGGRPGVEQRAEQARARFDRMMEDVRAAHPVVPATDAEIEALRRADEVERRLAELAPTTPDTSATPAARGRKGRG